jgi:hypothetical protein
VIYFIRTLAAECGSHFEIIWSQFSWLINFNKAQSRIEEPLLYCCCLLVSLKINTSLSFSATDDDMFEYKAEVNSDPWFGKQKFGGPGDALKFVDPNRFINQLYRTPFGLLKGNWQAGAQDIPMPFPGYGGMMPGAFPGYLGAMPGAFPGNPGTMPGAFPGYPGAVAGFSEAFSSPGLPAYYGGGMPFGFMPPSQSQQPTYQQPQQPAYRPPPPPTYQPPPPPTYQPPQPTNQPPQPTYQPPPPTYQPPPPTQRPPTQPQQQVGQQPQQQPGQQPQQQPVQQPQPQQPGSRPST